MVYGWLELCANELGYRTDVFDYTVWATLTPACGSSGILKVFDAPLFSDDEGRDDEGQSESVPDVSVGLVIWNGTY